MRGGRPFQWVWLFVCAFPALSAAQSSAYRLTFPEAERHLMQVELVLTDVPAGALELHMSRSSPGRYGTHDFVRNVSEVQVADAAGNPLQTSRPNPQVWRVERPGTSVRVRYKVSGDQIDGTYLAVDPTHAHLNMPAALMWARGFEAGAMTVRFEPPAGSGWRVATQLFPGSDDWTFRAPNLQYLMDSPAELSAFALRTFTVREGTLTPTFNIAVHHRGSDEDLNVLAASTERLVREASNVFGGFPRFDNGTYTFIADYLPTVVTDGMEHRNSTVLTSRGSVRLDLPDLLAGMSHEFFHVWNVERIRPRSLEPFNFDESNPSSELWLAEGFTQYYGPLVLKRAGLMTIADFASDVGAMVSEVRANPARLARTLEEMSRLAPVVDSAMVADVSGLRNSYLSYYVWGGAVALGLDLTLRDRTDGRVTLDTFMRALWEQYGKSGDLRPGYVEKPYTTADLKGVLAAVSGDGAFADDFFARYIQGHEAIDYDPLFLRAGMVWRTSARGRQILVPAEATGRTLTDAQRRLRTAWLGSSSSLLVP